MQKTDLILPPLSAPASRPNPVVGRCGPFPGVLLGCAVFLLYAFSFWLPATRNVLGYQAFVYALLFFICGPMWAANPVFWFGLAKLFQGHYRSAAKAGLLALLLALSECWMFWGELAAGYFLWSGSMAVLAVAGWWGSRDGGPPRQILGARWCVAEATQIASRFQRVPHAR
jgi:hypothetical protein